MSIKQGPRVSLERHIWRGSGIALVIEGVRLLANMPTSYPEEKFAEYLAVGLAVPVWAIWGIGRGWAEEDLSKVIPIKPRG